jgi:hypothetical protein
MTAKRIALRSVVLSLCLAAALFLAGAVRPASAHSVSFFTAILTGAAEVPGPGDPDGIGFAAIAIFEAENTICYKLKVFGIEPATAAHIHAGPAGVAGPVVVPLVPPNVNGQSRACTTASPDVISAILQDPSAYYVNVHNAPYPAGALRGQLSP